MVSQTSTHYLAVEIHAFFEDSHLEEVQLIDTPNNELANQASKWVTLASTPTNLLPFSADELIAITKKGMDTRKEEYQS